MYQATFKKESLYLSIIIIDSIDISDISTKEKRSFVLLIVCFQFFSFQTSMLF